MTLENVEITQTEDKDFAWYLFFQNATYLGKEKIPDSKDRYSFIFEITKDRSVQLNKQYMNDKTFNDIISSLRKLNREIYREKRETKNEYNDSKRRIQISSIR